MAQFKKEDFSWCVDKLIFEDNSVKYECKKCHRIFENQYQSRPHARKCYTNEEKEEYKKYFEERHSKIDYKKYATKLSDGRWECNGCHKICSVRSIFGHVSCCEEAVGREIASQYKSKRAEALKNYSLKTYGTINPFQSEDVKRKSKKTKAEKYNGDENYNNRDKAKQTCLDLYGNENFAKTEYFKEKAEQTNLAHFGVRHNWQLPEARLHPAKYIYNNIKFDSLPEICFYFYKRIHKEDIQRNSTFSFDYFIPYENKTHKYFPDFISNGEFIEIKSDIVKSADGRWKAPYIKPNWSKEQIKIENEKMVCKYDCAIENNVKIVYESEIIDIINKFKKIASKYRKNGPYERPKKKKETDLTNYYLLVNEIYNYYKDIKVVSKLLEVKTQTVYRWKRDDKTHITKKHKKKIKEVYENIREDFQK